MLSLDALKDFGANTEEGLKRCMGKESFYLMLIGKGIKDKRFESLGEALEKKDFDEAFELAHALKGIAGNLELAPIYKPISEISDALRAKKDIDYMPLYKEAMDKRNKLLESM